MAAGIACQRRTLSVRQPLPAGRPIPGRPSSAFPEHDHNHGSCESTLLDRGARVFEAKGMKLTDLRRRVLEEIAASHEALGAYDILERLSAKGPRLAPISVYRAIDALHQVRARPSAGKPQCVLRLPCEPRARARPGDPGLREVRPRRRDRRRGGVRSTSRGRGQGGVRAAPDGDRDVGHLRRLPHWKLSMAEASAAGTGHSGHTHAHAADHVHGHAADHAPGHVHDHAHDHRCLGPPDPTALVSARASP